MVVQRQTQRNPFAKPFAVSKEVIGAVCIPGDVVVDCYAGEGSLVRCALNMGMQIRAIEKKENSLRSVGRTREEANLKHDYG